MFNSCKRVPVRRMAGIMMSAGAILLLCSEASIQAARADTPRDLNTHHLFAPPNDRQVWEKRRSELRRQVLFSAGLLPMPEKTPLHPRVTGKIEAEDYTVENVALETRPGFFLCGNLYRPKGKRGPHPGIVNPHGHWANGRLEMQPDVPKADPQGKMGDGRGNLVSIGVNLARQGFVVFAYDAVGYNDTNQVSHDFAKTLDAWANGVSIMGLQLWDSIRVVDYLQGLKDVDPRRIGCTGASGGGSQTFLLTAVDDRVKVSVPVNMVSAHMQGGCLCENGPGLRVETDNVEIASLMAPRPMLLVACTGDWTKNNPSEEWPAVKKIYDLYGAGNKTSVVQFNYQHNYNVESREAMYAWFGKYLLNDPNAEHFREKPFSADAKAMRVWNASTPAPSAALREPELIAAMAEDARKLLDEKWPTDTASLERFRSEYQPALEASLATRFPTDTHRRGTAKAERALVISYTPESEQSARQLAAAAGKQYQVIGLVPLDPIKSGESDLWKNYFSTYNRTPLGERVDAIIKRVANLQASGNSRVDVAGIGEAGPWALFARALCPRSVSGRTFVDLADLAVDRDDPFLGSLYAPGIRRTGDIRTAAALVAPSPLFIHHTGSGLPAEKIRQSFTGAGGTIKIEQGAPGPEEVAGWLARR